MNAENVRQSDWDGNLQNNTGNVSSSKSTIMYSKKTVVSQE
jgi:hypothetical protein